MIIIVLYDLSWCWSTLRCWRWSWWCRNSIASEFRDIFPLQRLVYELIVAFSRSFLALADDFCLEADSELVYSEIGKELSLRAAKIAGSRFAVLALSMNIRCC